MKVKRNNITLDLISLKIEHGPDKDKEYLSLAINKDNINKIIEFIGAQLCADLLRTKINVLLQTKLKYLRSKLKNPDEIEKAYKAYIENGFSSVAEDGIIRQEAFVKAINEKDYKTIAKIASYMARKKTT